MLSWNNPISLFRCLCSIVDIGASVDVLYGKLHLFVKFPVELCLIYCFLGEYVQHIYILNITFRRSKLGLIV